MSRLLRPLALAALVAGLVAAPAQAASQDAEILSAIQRDLGLSPDRARARLAADAASSQKGAGTAAATALPATTATASTRTAAPAPTRSASPTPDPGAKRSRATVPLVRDRYGVSNFARSSAASG